MTKSVTLYETENCKVVAVYYRGRLVYTRTYIFELIDGCKSIVKDVTVFASNADVRRM